MAVKTMFVLFMGYHLYNVSLSCEMRNVVFFCVQSIDVSPVVSAFFYYCVPGKSLQLD